MPAGVERGSAADLPYLSASLPGCGGRLRSTPEDFRVEELPAYAPAGEGEHLYLLVEKRGLSTTEVAAHLHRALHLPPRAVGYAGRKDARAVATQWFSLHTPADPDPARLARDGVRILQASRHRNKLRLGHLAGNRFTVWLRDLPPVADPAPVLQRLAREGVPNYFGPQRLGERGRNALQGRALLHGSLPRPGGPERRRFLLNAYQAALFNEVVAARLEARDGLGRMLAGDLALLHRNGATFPVAPEDVPVVQARADTWELSPSAPLFGYRVPLAEGEPGRWEAALLRREGIQLPAFRLDTGKASPKGERRAVRVLPAHLEWEMLAEGEARTLRLDFTLPPGSFATALLREVMKTEPWPRLAPPDAADAPHTTPDAATEP